MGLALTPDDAFLLVVDRLNRRVAMLRATDGVWVRALKGRFRTLLFPRNVTVVPSTGEVLVSDASRDRFRGVVRFRSINDDTVVGTLGTGQGDGPTEFNDPCGGFGIKPLSIGIPFDVKLLFYVFLCVYFYVFATSFSSLPPSSLSTSRRVR